MIVTSSAIQNGYFNDKYGKRGTEIITKIPVLSFPFTISEEPEGTKSYGFWKTKMLFLSPDFHGFIGWRSVTSVKIFLKTTAGQQQTLFKEQTAGIKLLMAE